MKRWLPLLNSTGGPATAPRRALSDGYADHQGAIRTAVREVGQLVSSADGSGTSLALIPRPVLSLRAARHDRIIVWLGFQSKPRFPAPFLPLQASVSGTLSPTPSLGFSRHSLLLQASVSGTLPSTPSLAFRNPSSHSKPRFPAPFLPLQASVFPGTPSYSKPRFPVLFLPLQASLSGTLPPTPSLGFRHPFSHSKPRFFPALPPTPSLGFRYSSFHSKPRFPEPFLPLQVSLSGTLPPARGVLV